jgi:hypothetical protein
MGFRPHKIKSVEGLNAILDRATEIEQAKQRAVFEEQPQSGGAH